MERTKRQCVEARINQEPTKWTSPPYFNLIACQKVEERQMPGGKFLWVRMAPNTSGYTKERADRIAKETGTTGPTAAQVAHSIRTIHGGFTLDSKTAKYAIMLIGIGTHHGRMIFEYDGALYTRASRHEVQGRPRSSYPKVYQRHTDIWRNAKPGGYMCLKPFSGEWLKLKPRPKSGMEGNRDTRK